MIEDDTETARLPRREASPFSAAVGIIVGAAAGAAIWALVAAAVSYLW